VVQCSPGPFIVFFEWDRSDITPEAGSILDNAVQQYQNCGGAQVMIAGHADKSGSASYNVGLSQRRADAVRGYLASRAIPEGVISTEAFGEGRPRVETADGVREVQNRRVEVMYGPGSGAPGTAPATTTGAGTMTDPNATAPMTDPAATATPQQ
jgi:outer membrane protein OmpA-like peptidoglycan-associated protein